MSRSIVSPLAAVALATLRLKDKICPNYLQIRAELEKLDQIDVVAGSLSAEMPLADMVARHLANVPRHLELAYGVDAVPINSRWYLNGGKAPKSIAQAMAFLTIGRKPITGVYMPEDEDDVMFLAYIESQRGFHHRKALRVDDRFCTRLERGKISDQAALGYLEFEARTIDERMKELRERIGKSNVKSISGK